MNVNLFKAMLVLRGKTLNELGEVLGLKKQALSIKANGRRDFKASEIATIAEFLKLNSDEIVEIFGLGGKKNVG